MEAMVVGTCVEVEVEVEVEVDVEAKVEVEVVAASGAAAVVENGRCRSSVRLTRTAAAAVDILKGGCPEELPPGSEWRQSVNGGFWPGRGLVNKRSK